MRRLLPLLAAATLAGCGYVGDPLPPALNLAQRITDLRVVEYGDHLIVDFTIPEKTTDNLELRKVREVDLRVGVGTDPFDTDAWASGATKVPVTAMEPGAVEASIPIRPWIGKEVVIAVRVVNTRGRGSEWSNLGVARVVAPLPVPAAFDAQPDPGGVKLTWTSTAPQFRIYRRLAGGDDKPAMAGTAPQANWVDTGVEYGKRYEYMVQAVDGKVESEISEVRSITPRDIFPPAAPAGLNGAAATSSIELVWERNTEADLNGYRVYRAAEGRDFERIADMVETPTYGDRQVEGGKKYRYAVAAVDVSGNESPRSSVVEITAP